MMAWVRLLISEKDGVSSMRIMAFLSLLIGCGIAIYGVINNKDLTGLSVLVGVFVGSAFGGKAVQKFAENKNEANL